jgi:hypothetical protein
MIAQRLLGQILQISQVRIREGAATTTRGCVTAGRGRMQRGGDGQAFVGGGRGAAFGEGASIRGGGKGAGAQGLHSGRGANIGGGCRGGMLQHPIMAVHQKNKST